MKDYYSILGISSSAHHVDVKRAYRKLASTYHPDKNPDPKATEIFVEINEAYEVVGDPVKRAQYDLQRSSGWSSVLVEEPPVTRRHRDPAYRRRQSSSPKKTFAEEYYLLMNQYHHKVLWTARIGLFLGVLFIIDFYLPFHLEEESIAYILVMNGGRHSEQRFIIETKQGSSLRVPAEDISHFRGEPTITVAYSTIFSNAIWISPTYYSYRVNVHVLYTTLIFFPLTLLATSLMAFLFRKNTEFSFNLCIVAGVLILITISLL